MTQIAPEQSVGLPALLTEERIDDSLWRWATTDEMPALRERATQLLGLTEYSPGRFSRLISEMERAIAAKDPRAFDFMIAVADMRAGHPEAARQMQERVRRGIPLSLRPHYYRARAEYELTDPRDDARAVIAELRGPSAESRALAFRDATHFGFVDDLGAPTDLVQAMDEYLMVAEDGALFAALDLLSRRPAGFDALIPRVASLRVHHPWRPLRRASARALIRLRGGVSFTEFRRGRATLRKLTLGNARAWREGSGDLYTRACELAFFR